MSRVFSALTRKSIADATRRKGRTVLAILGIMVGVFGLTAINTMQDAVTAGIAYSHSQSVQSDLSFDVEAVDPSLAKTIAAVPNVQTVQIQTRGNGGWFVGSSTRPASVIQIVGYADPQHVVLGHFQLLSGRYPGSGEIVLEAGDAKLGAFALGDTIHVFNQGGNRTALKVVGIAKTVGIKDPGQSGNALGYMREDVLQNSLGPKSANDIEIKVYDATHAQQALNAVDSILQQNNVTVSDKSIIDNSNTPNASTIGLLTILRILLILSVGVGGLLIINTVTTLILEQVRVIGTMKALGGTRGAILRSYFTTVGIYAIFGTVLGLSLGILAGYVLALLILNMENFSMGPFTVLPITIGISLAVGLGVPLLAALFPVWAGTRITVHQALSAYGIASGNSESGSQRIRGPRFTWIPQLFWLGLRGLFRRRQRTITTLLVLAFSSLAFLSVATATYSVGEKSSHLMDNYDYDLTVQVLQGTQSWPQLQNRIMSIPNVGRVERLSSDFISTTWGNMRFTNVETNTQIYQRHLISGRWFTANERNVILISDDAANATGLKVGNTLTFTSSGFSGKATWKIIGIVHDPRADISTAGVVVTSVESYNHLLGWRPNVAKTVVIQATDRSSSAESTLEGKVGDTLRGAGIQIGLFPKQSELQLAQNQFTLLYVMLFAPTLIIALVSCLALYNTLITSVMERQREIGIWRSMGARNWQVGFVFFVEALTLAGLTWVISAAVGVPVAYGFLRLVSKLAVFNIPFAFNPLSLVTMLIAVIVIAALATPGPAWRAASLRIANILRYEQ